jgi:hypothetical protein
MRYRNLLIAVVLSVIMPAAANTLKAQQYNTVPHNNNNFTGTNNNTVSNNNVEMNAYTYTPVLYQQGASTAEMRIFPNPARNYTNIYIKGFKGSENGEVIIYNPGGKQVYKNVLQTGNNNIDLGNCSDGIYTVKVFTRDRSSYSYRLMVQK